MKQLTLIRALALSFIGFFLGSAASPALADKAPDTTTQSAAETQNTCAQQNDTVLFVGCGGFF